MKTSSPWLLPLLRSQTQGELLAWLYLDPEREVSLTDLAARFHVSVPTIMREGNRLVEAGLLRDQRIGNVRRLAARTDTPIFQPLAALLAVTYGPIPILTQELANIDGIEKALIYGSWAARYHQEPGTVPNDIDVIVIGVTDQDEIFEAAERAAARLGREVNIRRVRADDWNNNTTDPFLASVRERPQALLPLTQETL